MLKVLLQNEPIDVDFWMSKAAEDSDGALLSFVGRARNSSSGKKVTHLEYEAYGTMAEKELEKIGASAFEQWSITNCIIVHRLGRVEIGESSILIAVSSPHRDESFRSVRFIIDTIKKTVPIWKKEFYSDGAVWISDRG
jgi:molybdopterin synthase catalytic subunit